jgi:hypothetical protein
MFHFIEFKGIINAIKEIYFCAISRENMSDEIKQILCNETQQM